jgi:hypothetical protein
MGLGVEQREMLHTAVAVPTRDASVVAEGERRLAEHPLRVAEFRLGLVQPFAVPIAQPFEVPPAGSVAREHEIAGRAPRRLPDRLVTVTT